MASDATRQLSGRIQAGPPQAPEYRSTAVVPRLVILAHSAERTGPPVFLLRLLRWVRRNAAVDVTLVLAEGGPLLEDLRALAPTFVAGVDDLDRVPPADTAYVNTAASIRLLDRLPHPPSCVVSHVHELATGLEAHLPPTAVAQIVDRSQRILVVSEPVASTLVRQAGADPTRISVVPGFVPRQLLDEPPPPAPQATSIAERGPLVVASGTLGWRKGVDLFVEIAALMIAQTALPVQFVWVGGDLTSPASRTAHERVASSGLAGRITFVGEQPDPLPWFVPAQVFILPSREDAFPLVCLEAAALFVPTVTFANGGIAELVRDDAGVIVAFPDRQAMAEAVLLLLNDQPRRAALGATARRRIAEHHTDDIVVPTILDALVGSEWRTVSR